MNESSAPIRAITFDFWRTLFYTSVNFQERRDARVRALVEIIDCTERDAKEALKLQEQQFLHTHIHEQRTLVPEDAVTILSSELNLSLDPTISIELADALERATLQYPPSPIEGAVEAVTRAVDSKISSPATLSPTKKASRNHNPPCTTMPHHN